MAERPERKDTLPSMQAVKTEPQFEPVDYQLAVELRTIISKYGKDRVIKLLPYLRTDNL